MKSLYYLDYFKIGKNKKYSLARLICFIWSRTHRIKYQTFLVNFRVPMSFEYKVPGNIAKMWNRLFGISYGNKFSIELGIRDDHLCKKKDRYSVVPILRKKNSVAVIINKRATLYKNVDYNCRITSIYGKPHIIVSEAKTKKVVLEYGDEYRRKEKKYFLFPKFNDEVYSKLYDKKKVKDLKIYIKQR